MQLLPAAVFTKVVADSIIVPLNIVIKQCFFRAFKKNKKASFEIVSMLNFLFHG